MFKVVVSDLHLGAGYAREGNGLEDFWYADEFADLVADLVTESDRTGADAELIFNGDTFEMLQVPHVLAFDPGFAYLPQQYHSSSEVDSARKMELIISGHPVFFTALRRFLQIGPPRRSITFVKGNHDLNLHWLAVQDRIRRAVGATGPRVGLVTFEEQCVSRDGIYVEHGNQYAEWVSRVEDMREPHHPNRPGQLLLPAGSWFVMDFFNEVERQRYWIDGVKPVHALIWYALAHDFAFAARAIAALLRTLPGIVAEAMTAPYDSAPYDPRADLVWQLEDARRAAEIGERREQDDVFRAWFDGEMARLLPALPEVAGQAVEAPAAAPDGVGRAESIRRQVRSSLYTAAARCAAQARAAVVTFGHTHDAGTEMLPGGATYINGGTWTWRADFSGVGKESWKELFAFPERFVEDRSLTYVRIDYDEAGTPTGRLLRHGERGTGPVLSPSWWRRFVRRLGQAWRALFRSVSISRLRADKQNQGDRT